MVVTTVMVTTMKTTVLCPTQERGGPVDDSTSNLGVNNDDESIDETEEAAKPHTNDINSNLD